MKKAEDKCSAMWHINICVNVSTGEFHTENDCSYTLISVPKQNTKEQIKCGNEYQFLFQLNNNIVIALTLTPDLSFLFLSTFLSHRQKGNDSIENNKYPFVNLSSCGNKRLLTHIIK